MASVRNTSILRGPSFLIPQDVRLHQLFERNLLSSDVCQKTALVYEDIQQKQVTQMTYLALDTKANQIARNILRCMNRKVNVDGDYVVAVCMEPSDKLIVTLLAIWKAGAAYLPLDVNSPVNKIQHILSEATPCLLIGKQNGSCDGSFEGIPSISYQQLEKGSNQFSSEPVSHVERLPLTSMKPIAIILYTSGSTGIPKGVRLPHQVVMNRLNWQWRTFPFGAEESVCVFKTALTFVDAVSEIWAPLLYSNPRTLLIIPRDITQDPERLIHVLEQYQVERLVLVPTLLRSMLMYLDYINNNQYYSDGTKLLHHLKLWVCSGETLPVVLAQQFLNYFKTGEHLLCNFYGSTEIMGDVSYYIVQSDQQLCFGDKVPIGIPVDNTSLYLLDKNLEPVEEGEIGELYVSGENLAAGYVANRDQDRFVTNNLVPELGSRLYRTGDYGRIEKNTLQYEGRTDSQVKVRGHRVDLSEIQTVLNKLNNVIDKSAVLCYKPGDINQALLAFVTLQEGVNLTSSDVEKLLKRSLTSYAVPQVLILESIPLLNNGKIDRQYLLKLYEDTSNICKETKACIDYKDIKKEKLNAAKCLFETIAYVLGGSIRSHISATSNFYELGGNSLNCIYTITKLKDKGYIVGIADFISAQNLGTILDYMYKEDADTKENIPDFLYVRNANTKNCYRTEMLTEKHKEHVCRIIADSFYEKADLEQWLRPKPQRDTYIKLMEAMWNPLLEKNLSFAVYSEENQNCVGVSLNFDAQDEPEVIVNNNLIVVFEFLEFLEGPIRDKQLPDGKNQVLHSFMMGTAAELTSSQNVNVVTYMEEENINLARCKGFKGIFTTNTNALTQQLGTDVFGYKTLADYQVNQYVAPDGTKPFSEAPDEQRAVCSWKVI